MDSKTTVKELKDIVQKFCEDRNWDQFHSPKELAIGISTEANELLEKFRFKSEEQMQEMMNDLETKKEVSDELVDTMYFILRFAQMNDIDLSKSLNKKMESNEEKYPLEKSKNSNKKYNEFE